MGKVLSVTYFRVSQGVLWLPICLFLSLCHWLMNCLFFCFWYRLKGNSSWNNLNNSSYFITLFFFFFLLQMHSLDWLSLLPWWWPSFYQAHIPVAQQMVLKSKSPFEQRNRARLTHQIWCPHLKGGMGIYDFLFLYSCLCLCEHPVPDLALCIVESYLVWALRCSYKPTIDLGLSPFTDAFSSVFVLSRFSLPLLARHWKFFCKTGFFLLLRRT